VLSSSTSSRRYCVPMIGAASMWDIKRNTYGTCECISPKNYTDASQSTFYIAVEREPWRISRGIMTELGLSHPTAFQIFRDDQLHPYQYSQRTSVFKRSSSVRAVLRMATTRCELTPFTLHFMDRRRVFCAWGCVPRSKQSHLGTG
jgi:hypothetical protein